MFELDLDLDLPPGALSLIGLLLLPEADWIKARDKGKPPKPRAEPDNLRILVKALEKRCGEYPKSIQVCFSLIENRGLLTRTFSGRRDPSSRRPAAECKTCDGRPVGRNVHSSRRLGQHQGALTKGE